MKHGTRMNHEAISNGVVCRVASPGEPRQRGGAVAGAGRPLRFSATKTIALIALFALSACGNFEPADKTARYDPVTGELALPAPCPDWAQTTNTNYNNERHSNYGCAVNRNMALQLADPQDMNEGHGTNRPDAGMTSYAIDQYRQGKIPVPLTSTQSTFSSQ